MGTGREVWVKIRASQANGPTGTPRPAPLGYRSRIWCAGRFGRFKVGEAKHHARSAHGRQGER